jgi:hypothetical protein
LTLSLHCAEEYSGPRWRTMTIVGPVCQGSCVNPARAQGDD